MTLINNEIIIAERVIGKIANDTTNPVITTYLNGLYGDVKSDKAVNFAIEQLLHDHLFPFPAGFSFMPWGITV